MTLVYEISVAAFTIACEQSLTGIDTLQMLENVVDVSNDEKTFMHMWNSFVRKHRYILLFCPSHSICCIC